MPVHFACTCRFTRKDEFSDAHLIEDTECGFHGTRRERFTKAEGLAADIHQAIKRGADTENHGLIGNLSCILDHVCSKNDPDQL